jgi:hypothetical protein
VSIWSAPDGPRRIVWTINWMALATPSRLGSRGRHGRPCPPEPVACGADRLVQAGAETASRSIGQLPGLAPLRDPSGQLRQELVPLSARPGTQEVPDGQADCQLEVACHA